MGASNITLDGTETTVIKALGVGGAEVNGPTLFERCKGLDVNDFLDTLKGLIDVGLIDADSSSFYSLGATEKLTFRVNSGYAKELREALDPSPDVKKSRRVRRE